MKNFFRRAGFLLLVGILIWSSVFMFRLLFRRIAAIQSTNQVISVTPSVSESAGLDAAQQQERFAQATATAQAAQPVTQVRLVSVVEGFDHPLYLTHAGDERLFVVEKPGRIRVVVDGQTQTFLDIADRVFYNGNEWDERGLLGMAFHPAYQQNGRFFIHYINQESDSIIASFQVDPQNPNRADASSEKMVLQIAQPYEDHKSGQLQFGPDGFLYVGLGDGGEWGDPHNNGQNTTTLLGSILRLDVNMPVGYGVPDDNPFVNTGNGRSEIWAYGLRNPWRFSFDRLSGDIYLTDVGQAAWEELNYLPANAPGGANFGWKVTEGLACYEAETCDRTSFTEPILTYSHSEGCAIVGGYVYRGTQFPTLSGNYFFADYCFGTVFSLFLSTNGEWEKHQVYEDDLFIASFGEDVQGELYALEHLTGTVYQIQP